LITAFGGRDDTEDFMPKSEKSLFDPKSFLAKVGEGKVILKLKKTKPFLPKETSPTQFSMFKREGSRLSLSLNRARKRLSGQWNLDSSLVKDVSMAVPCGFRQPQPWRNAWLPPSKKNAMLAELQKEPKFSELFMAHLLSP
jgi:CRP/FNR family cyclic AMP-dependent transcriptional regulator